MIRQGVCILLMLGFLTTGSCVFAALTVNLSAIHKAPVIDGKVESHEMAGASKIDFIMIGGFDKPKYPTQVYTWLSPEGMYVGFVCADPAPEKAVVTAEKENGAVFNDDSAQIFLTIDRESTKDNYMHFAVNTKGVKYSTRMEDNTPVSKWTAGVSTSPGKWEAEFLIPNQALKGSDSLPFWRCNFARHRPARGSDPAETSAWVNPGPSLHNYKSFGFLQLNQKQRNEVLAAAAVTTPTLPASTAIPLPVAPAAPQTTTVTLAATTITLAVTTATLPIAAPAPPANTAAASSTASLVTSPLAVTTSTLSTTSTSSTTSTR